MIPAAPDGFRSWVVAAACCYINMIMFGITRLSGVMFVASMARYKVGREAASLPYTFSGFVGNIAGPLAGYLAHKYGIRSITTIGCVLAAIGCGACYFAENILVVLVLWGFIYGSGYGLIVPPLPVSINQYFKKQRATASGVSFAGICLGLITLPPIVNNVLENHGLSVTFLALSSLILTCVPLTLILKKPEFLSDTDKIEEKKLTNEKQKLLPKNVKYYSEVGGHKTTIDKLVSEIKTGLLHPSKETEKRKKINYLSRVNNLYSCNKSDGSIDNAIGSDTDNFSVSREQFLTSYSESEIDKKKRIAKSDSEVPMTKDAILASKSFENDQSHLVFKKNVEDSKDKDSKVYNIILGADAKAKQSLVSYDEQHSAVHETQNKTVPCKPNEIYMLESAQMLKTSKSSNKNVPERSNLSILIDPIFIMTIITVSLYNFMMNCLFTIIVDFATDIGIGQDDQIFLFIGISVGELTGRLGLGWVTDKKYMSRTAFMALSFICQGITAFGIGLSNEFYTLMVVLTLYGLLHSGVTMVYPLIVSDYIPADKQTITISSSSFLAGPLTLCISPLIGYFREELGSYVYLFFGIGLISILCGILWTLTPCILKFRKSSRNTEVKEILP